MEMAHESIDKYRKTNGLNILFDRGFHMFRSDSEGENMQSKGDDDHVSDTLMHAHDTHAVKRTCKAQQHKTQQFDAHLTSVTFLTKAGFQNSRTSFPGFFSVK